MEMTQQQLAQVLGVTNKAVSKWERGLGLPDTVSYTHLMGTENSPPFDAPMRRNPSEKSVIHCERVIITATPRKIFMVASVTMISGMCFLYKLVKLNRTSI